MLFQYFDLHAQLSGQPLIDSLEGVLSKNSEAQLKTEVLNKLSFAYLEKDPQKSKDYALRALHLAVRNREEKEVGNAYNNMACNFTYASRYDSGIYYFKQALSYYKKCGHDKGMADVLGNMGTLQYYNGNFPEALDHFFQALKLFEKLNYPMGIGNTLTGIGSLYMDQKLYDKALYYDSIGLQTYKNIQDADGIALVLGNMANVLGEKKQIKEAESLYLQALIIYDSLDNKIGIARSRMNLGLLYLDEKDYQRAKTTLEQSQAIFSAFDYPTGVIMTQGNLGVTYKLCAEYFEKRDSIVSILPGNKNFLLQKAEFNLKNAILLAEETGDLNPVIVFAKDLSKVYTMMGKHAEALFYFKKYVTVQDSLHSQENKVQIEQLGIQRELDLKEKQIEIDTLAVEKKRNERLYFFMGMALLLLMLLSIYRNFKNQKKANGALTQLNGQIAESNHLLEDKNFRLTNTLHALRKTQDQLVSTEKQKVNAELRSKISQDIHDDISSNLTKISWLAETIKARARTNPENPNLETLDKISHFSRETVSKLSEIIWSTNPERDNLESMIVYMRNFISQYLEDQHMPYSVSFPEEIPQLTLNPELRRNLYLVLKEAVHNAVKYSKASKLDVFFELKENGYLLTVADDGLGFEPGQKQGSGYGMANMKRRMEAIGGTMTLETAPGKGTRLLFSGFWQV